MKILASDMVFSSDHQFEQLDASLNEKSSKTRSFKRRQALPDIMNSGTMLVDRVSISQTRSHEYQANYAAEIISRSLVTSSSSEDVISYEQQYAVEKLIGGMIEKDVIISNIRDKEDVILRDGDSIQADGATTRQRLGQSQSLGWEMSLRQTNIHFEEEHVSVSSLGQVTTQDGRKIEFSLDMSMDRAFVSRTQEETLIQRFQQQINLTDPLVISLDGKAPQLSDVQFEFDLDSDGQTQMVNFVNSGSGFLAFDRNNDQVINDGSELFGPGTGNGFGELAAFDDDQNNWIDENDAVFSKLSVWTRNEDGQDQLISLKDAGVGAISLDYAQTQFNMTASDNTLQGQLKSSGIFLFENGNVGSVSQVDLVSNPVQRDIQKETVIHASPIEEPVNFSQVGGTETIAGNDQSQEAANPLKELLDRIEELKEKMGRFYEGMNLMEPGNRRKRSRFGHYKPMNIDSNFISGYNGGPIRSRRRRYI